MERINKDTAKDIISELSPKLVKHPLFMYFCKELEKREAFIKDYFRYYIPKWIKEGNAFVSEDHNVVICLIDPLEFEYKFKGIKAHNMKKYKFSSNVFMHQENLETVCDILLPYKKKSRIMLTFMAPEVDMYQEMDAINGVLEIADREDMTVVYDTFNRAINPLMEQRGFNMAYRKQFLNTQYIETMLTYNM